MFLYSSRALGLFHVVLILLCSSTVSIAHVRTAVKLALSVIGRWKVPGLRDIKELFE